MSATMTWDMTGFSDQLRALQAKSGRSARSMVTYWARKLVRKAAWNTPISHGGYAARGRLRAGWWPAATMLGISNIYTPLPNAGEGVAIDARASGKPSVTIGNSVPYVLRLKVGLEWWEEALTSVEAQMERELEHEMNRHVLA